MLKKRFFMMLSMCVVFIMFAASFANANPADWPKKVRIGLIPTEGGADIIARFKPLIDHLESVLGIEVEGKSASDYGDHHGNDS